VRSWAVKRHVVSGLARNKTLGEICGDLLVPADRCDVSPREVRHGMDVPRVYFDQNAHAQGVIANG
jgi:hypothetical protein